ncbi:MULTISPECIES: hypothetical protein [unclassified Glutamicibacter]|uniref:hypothetical protein n=1 Tax=unclassified Glutamicibacter TaxID=2627139 RepID=UPI00381593C0
MGKYEAQGTGLSDPASRKKLYTAAIVVAALIVATLVTLRIITLDDVQSFITLTVSVVGILGGVVGLVAASLARANVDPPK